MPSTNNQTLVLKHARESEVACSSISTPEQEWEGVRIGPNHPLLKRGVKPDGTKRDCSFLMVQISYKELLAGEKEGSCGKKDISRLKTWDLRHMHEVFGSSASLLYDVGRVM